MMKRSRASAKRTIFSNSSGVATAAVGFAGKFTTIPFGRFSAFSVVPTSESKKSIPGPTATGIVSAPARTAP